MFVRVINRQSRFINQEKMQYSEILNCPKQLELLEKVRLLRRLSVNDIDSWLTSLTKVQLCEILSDCQVLASKKNADKAMILETVLLSCTSSQCLASKITSHFHVKNFEQNLAYLLFLFFGNTHSGLDKFSLRDMGVLKTRKDHTAPIARFDDIQQAKAVFHYSFKIGQLKRNELDMQSLSTKSIQIEQPKGIVNCFQSEPLKNEYYFLLGKALLNENHSLALEYFKNEKLSKEKHGEFFPPHVLILDINMPGEDGLAVLRSLRPDNQVPVVMLTALDKREDKVKGLEAGADDFLTKPFEDLALMSRVDSLTRTKMMVDQIQQTPNILKQLESRYEELQRCVDESKRFNMEEVQARGAKVILISDKAGIEAAGDSPDHVIEVPSAPDLIMPILASIPIQL